MALRRFDHLHLKNPLDDFPELDEWRADFEGEVAAMCGCKRKDNPYPYPSTLWVQWNNGFCRECPRRDESEEEAEWRASYHRKSLAELKYNGAWSFVKPPTPKELAEWAQDGYVVSTIMRRRWARQRRQQRERE